MAAGNSTLRFTVEVAADQATGALNALSQAFNQAGITARTAMLGVGNSARPAAEAVSTFEGKVKALKGEIVSGNRTVDFFARSLNGIVPAGSAAGEGIRLLAGGLIGGFGLGFAIEAVMAGVKVFGEHLHKEAEDHKKAAEEAKKHAEALDKITAGWREYAVAQQSAMLGGAALKYLKDRTEATDALNKAIIAETDAQYDVQEIEADRNRLNPESLSDTIKAARAMDQLRDANKRLEEATRKRTEAQQALDAVERGYSTTGRTVDALVKANKDRAERDKSDATARRQAERQHVAFVIQIEEQGAEERQRIYLETYAALNEIAGRAKSLTAAEVQQEVRLVQEAEARKLRALEDRLLKERVAKAKKEAMEESHGSGFEEEGARAPEYQKLKAEDYEKAQDKYNKELRETTALYERWGAVAADTITDVITGQRSLSQSMAAVGRMVLQSIIQMLINKAAAALAAHVVERPANIAEVTASAGVAGAKAAESVAATPFIGPALAAAAMAETSSLILASMLPLASAAGGMNVPNDMLAFVHKDERILPAKDRKRMDRFFEQGGGGGITLNFPRGIMDARDLQYTLTKRSSAVRSSIRRLQRTRRA